MLIIQINGRNQRKHEGGQGSGQVEDEVDEEEKLKSEAETKMFFFSLICLQLT